MRHMNRSLRSFLNIGSLPQFRDLPLSNVRNTSGSRRSCFSSGQFLSFILLLAIALAATATARSQTYGVSDRYGTFTIAAGSLPSSTSVERHVFELVNDERARYGLSRLAWVERAADSARYHSHDMAANNFFAHMDRNGKRASARADEFGLSDWRRIGENIAWLTGANDTATRVVRLWMESPGHRDNILNRSYRESGVGLARASDGKVFFTQVFILR